MTNGAYRNGVGAQTAANFNGLSGSEVLAAGSTVRIPAKVTNVHNKSSTFRTYDRPLAMGSVAPDQNVPVNSGTG